MKGYIQRQRPNSVSSRQWPAITARSFQAPGRPTPRITGASRTHLHLFATLSRCYSTFGLILVSCSEAVQRVERFELMFLSILSSISPLSLRNVYAIRTPRGSYRLEMWDYLRLGPRAERDDFQGPGSQPWAILSRYFRPSLCLVRVPVIDPRVA